ncbi:VWA domain-containing protein, partial [Streptomyces sp. MCAF7]
APTAEPKTEADATDTPAEAATTSAAADTTEPAADAEPEADEATADAEATPNDSAPTADAEPVADKDTTEVTVEVADSPAPKAEGDTPAGADTTAAAADEKAAAEAKVTAPAADADATDEGDAAIPLSDVETRAPGLVSLYKSAADALAQKGLVGRRAAVYLVLDRSGSMRSYYKDGTVQHLAEQALALSANLDDDGTVPVVFFSTDIDGTADVDLANYSGRIEELHSSLGHMGRTNYHHAIKAVIDHYQASGATDPAFVIFQTDGAPTTKAAAEKALCEAARLPIFWQFIGFGDPDAKGFDFLRKLDVLSVPDKRVVDNAGFFHAGQDPRALSNAELYGQLMVEFPEWLREAREAGVLS